MKFNVPRKDNFNILVSESLEKRIFHRHLTTVQLFDTFSLCQRHTISQQLKVKHCNFRYFGKEVGGWDGVIKRQASQTGNDIDQNIELFVFLKFSYCLHQYWQHCRYHHLYLFHHHHYGLCSWIYDL